MDVNRILDDVMGKVGKDDDEFEGIAGNYYASFNIGDILCEITNKNDADTVFYEVSHKDNYTVKQYYYAYEYYDEDKGELVNSINIYKPGEWEKVLLGLWERFGFHIREGVQDEFQFAKNMFYSPPYQMEFEFSY